VEDHIPALSGGEPDLSELNSEQRALIDGIWEKAKEDGFLLSDGKIRVTHEWMIATGDRVLDELRQKELAGENDAPLPS
jgi:hypothetical protein